MRITPKQFDEIEVVRHFGRLGFSSSQPPRAVIIADDENGPTAEEVYVLVTVRGKTSVTTRDRHGLCFLLWGQRWLNLHIAQYRKDMKDGLLSEADLREWYADAPSVRAFVLRSLGIPEQFLRIG